MGILTPLYNGQNTHAIGKVWNIPIYAMRIYRSQVIVFWEKHARVTFLDQSEITGKVTNNLGEVWQHVYSRKRTG